jgi:hypothetical protein
VGGERDPPARARAGDAGRVAAGRRYTLNRLELTAIRPGLWRWTAPHPDWQPSSAAEPSDWPQEVGCVLYETDGHAVFIDPLAADDDAFWSWADARCAGREVCVLETIRFHRRSRDRFIERYGASTQPPPVVEPLEFALGEETVYWIGKQSALIPGDLLVSSGGELELCPQSWLDYLAGRPDRHTVAAALAPLRALAVELVLVSHGPPVRSDGAAAVARALDAA